MASRKGVFIVIEGSDGSGKATQLNLLKERLSAIGHDVAVFDFPRYDQPSSYFVQKYLNGDYGPASKVSPYTASLFYALDRYDASKDIKKALDQGKIVLSNRYTGANMAHQGSKFSDPAEQRGFFVWADNLEFQLLSIPRPDINLFLRVPASISIRLIEERSKKSGKKLDEHEKDHAHLKKALETYDTLCQLFPRDFRAIECTKNGKLLSIPQINNQIWQYLQPRLPSEKPNPSHSVVVTLGLSEKAAAKPLAAGRDSIVVPFKNASLFLRLQMERLKPGALEPALSDLTKNPNAIYSPGNLAPNLINSYKQSLQMINRTQTIIQEKLEDFLQKTDFNTSSRIYSSSELALPLTPLASLTDFEISLSKTDIKPVASRLLASDSEEVVWAAKQLYLFARQNWPADFKAPLESGDDQLAINSVIAKLADERLPLNSSPDEPIRLLESSPRQEFDLLAESIYPYSNLSLAEISQEVSDWPYQQKYDSLRQALAQPGILSKVRYKMDVISDQLTLAEMAQALNLADVQVQAQTPRYGYDVAQIIEAAGIDEHYDTCFDESLRLFSLLQAAGRDDLAGYSTLLGHKARWQLNTDAARLRLVLGSDHKDSLISPAILEKVVEVHPLVWEVLSGSQISMPKAGTNGRQRVRPSHLGPSRKPRSKK